MTVEEAHFFLRGLDELSVENLKAGRITRQVLLAALKTAGKFDYENTFDLIVASEQLNDWIAAGRVLHESEVSIES